LVDSYNRFSIRFVGPTLRDKQGPNSIRQIMPVNILRYMFKSPFLEIRASNSYRRGI
jgi:hypothetical protein